MKINNIRGRLVACQPNVKINNIRGRLVACQPNVKINNIRARLVACQPNVKDQYYPCKISWSLLTDDFQFGKSNLETVDILVTTERYTQVPLTMTNTKYVEESFHWVFTEAAVVGM